MSTSAPNNCPRRRADAPLSPRDRVLAAWRGVDLSHRAIEREDAARSAGDLIGQVLESVGLDRKRGEAEIVKAWNNLIDPTVTEHAQPDSLVRGTLFVKVDSSVWLDEIVRYRRREILKQLQHCFGRQVIQRISFKIG